MLHMINIFPKYGLTTNADFVFKHSAVCWLRNYNKSSEQNKRGKSPTFVLNHNWIFPPPLNFLDYILWPWIFDDQVRQITAKYIPYQVTFCDQVTFLWQQIMFYDWANYSRHGGDNTKSEHALGLLIRHPRRILFLWEIIIVLCLWLNSVSIRLSQAAVLQKFSLVLKVCY